MATYLFTYRAPQGYKPSAETGEAWSSWFQELGAHLRDRGNPVFSADSIGANGHDTNLGGYSLVRATSLEKALQLAKRCPMLNAGGGVEVGEVTNLDQQFDEWLDRHPVH